MAQLSSKALGEKKSCLPWKFSRVKPSKVEGRLEGAKGGRDGTENEYN